MLNLLTKIKITGLAMGLLFVVIFSFAEGAFRESFEPSVAKVAWCSVARIFDDSCVEDLRPRFILAESNVDSSNELSCIVEGTRLDWRDCERKRDELSYAPVDLKQKTLIADVSDTTGVSSLSGQNGQNGKDGQDGKDGQNGVNGQDGKDGKDGQDGQDGDDGADGQDGTVGSVTVQNGGITASLSTSGNLTFGLTTTCAVNEILKWNGTLWTCAADSGVGGGITNLNGLSGAVQSFATGTAGTDFNISSTGTTHTFNLPTASATNRGLLSSTDWTLS